jgi:thiamine biosynthesis lipoprotein ApbE
MSKEAEAALENAVGEMQRADSQFEEKIKYWDSLVDKFNHTELSPMELNMTPEGAKILEGITAKVKAAMLKKFGE